MRGFACAVYSWGGVQLSTTGDVVGWWKEYFEDILNLTDTPSLEEAESADLLVTRAKITEVLHNPLSVKVLVMDEVFPEFLKALGVILLFWITRLFNIASRDSVSGLV